MRRFRNRDGIIETTRHKRLSKAVAGFSVEGLEQRICLASAIAAFGAPQTFFATGRPQMVTVADLNCDGKPDLIAANTVANHISVYKGFGDGTFEGEVKFTIPLTFAAGTGPYSVSVADVNGDGKPDLIVLNRDNNNVGILLGNGDATFQAQTTFAVGASPRSMAVADLNHDGKIDIVTGNNSSSNVSVLLGNGNGTFQAAQTLPTTLAPLAVTIADFNGDGKPDLVTANQGGNNVSVLLGNGDGTFAAQLTFAAGGQPMSVAAADMNADGHIDLVVANSGVFSGSNSVGVLLGNGNGTFKPMRTYGPTDEPMCVTVADINGDGKPDVAAANYKDGGSISVLLGNGDGTLQPGKTFSVGTSTMATTSAFWVTAADLNGDGRLDLVAADSGAATLAVLPGDVPPTVVSINRASLSDITGSGSVTFTVTFNEPVTGVDAADFVVPIYGNVAGTLPQVTGSGSVYTVTISGITGNGTLGLNLVDDGSIKDAAGNPLQPGGGDHFGTPRQFSPGGYAADVTSADINRDGKPDLAVATPGGVSVLLGNGDGTFQSPITYSVGTFSDSVTAADVNGDGRPDLLVTDRDTSGLEVLLGNGDGTFQPTQTFSTGSHPCSSVVVSDFNGDGRLDVAVNNLADVYLSVLLGNGNGTFKPQQTISISAVASSLSVSDLNGDGRPDLVLGRYFSNISVLIGNGDGTFQAQQTYLAGNHWYSVAVCDVNGDGKPDIVGANRFDETAAVLLGNGNGTFKPPVTYDTSSAGSFVDSVEISDFNRDGKPDLLLGTDSDLVILLGNGNGTFQTAQSFSTSSTPGPFILFDSNGDGQPDVAVANRNNSNLTLLLSNANGDFVGQDFWIVPYSDTIGGTAGADEIILQQDADHSHIDWFVGGLPSGQMAINDLAGLTINGNGSRDLIYVYNNYGSPLPYKLNLDGTFMVENLAPGNPLVDTTLDIGSSTVYINYQSPAADPLSAIRGYLNNGYNAGTWTGTATATTGAIQSTAAAGNPTNFTIGYADSADVGNPAGLPANTIELRYTAIGDTNLDGTVGLPDLAALLKSYGTGTQWDQGDITYSAATGLADLAALLKNYNSSVASPAALSEATPVFSTAAAIDSADSGRQTALMPTIEVFTAPPKLRKHTKTRKPK